MGVEAGRLGRGWGWPGMDFGWLSRATKSGRGGTTGRATGWPANRSQLPRRGPRPSVGAAGGGAAGIGRRWGAPAAGSTVFGDSATEGGMGWCGPERIWPGLGAIGTALA